MTTRGRTVAALAVVMALFLVAGAAALRRPSDITRSRNATGPIPSTHVIRRLDVMSDRASDPLGGFFVGPHGLSWSPDGRLLAATPDIGDGQAWIWTVDGTLVHQIKRGGHYPAVYQQQNIAFVDGDSKILLPPGSDAPNTAMSLYELKTGALLRDIPGPWAEDPRVRRNAAVTIVPSPDQTLVAVLHSTFEPQPVGLYSTRTWQLLASLHDGDGQRFNPPISLAFSPDGRRLAVGKQNGSVIIYDTNTDEVVRKIDAYTQPLHHAPVASLSFSPDGSYIAIGGRSGGAVNIPPPGKTLADNIMTPIIQPYPLQVFRVADGKSVASAPGQSPRVRDVKWSPRGQLIAFIGGDSLTRLWGPFGPTAPQIIPNVGKSFDLAFSPDGLILAVSQHFRIDFVAITNQH